MVQVKIKFDLWNCYYATLFIDNKKFYYNVVWLLVSAAGHICPFPFFFNDAYYDKCTRISVNGEINNPEGYYWCPSPFNVTYGSEEYHNVAVFSNGGEVGKCPDFAKPPGSSQILFIH